MKNILVTSFSVISLLFAQTTAFAQANVSNVQTTNQVKLGLAKATETILAEENVNKKRAAIAELLNGVSSAIDEASETEDPAQFAKLKEINDNYLLAFNELSVGDAESANALIDSYNQEMNTAVGFLGALGAIFAGIVLYYISLFFYYYLNYDSIF